MEKSQNLDAQSLSPTEQILNDLAWLENVRDTREDSFVSNIVERRRWAHISGILVRSTMESAFAGCPISTAALKTIWPILPKTKIPKEDLQSLETFLFPVDPVLPKSTP